MVLIAIGVAVLAAATVWFFVSTDKRGPTARLQADAPYYHAYLPSLLFDRDLDFDNQYRITKNWYRFGKTEIGRRANVFGIGPAMFTWPWFLTGHGLARVAGASADGFSSFEVKATLFASLLFSAGALFFVFRLLRRRLGGAYLPALIPLLLACSGPVIYYAIRQPGYSHPFATFWTAWLVDYADATFDRDTPRPLSVWLALGALVGLATLARPQLALWATMALFAAADDLRLGWVAAASRPGPKPGPPRGETRPEPGPPGREHSIRLGLRLLGQLAPRWAAGAAVAILLFSPQLLAWNALHGSYYVVPQGPDFMRWDQPAWSEVLMSSRNGLLPWAPLYALAAIGLIAALRRHPRLSAALLLGVALQTVANGAAWDWWAGGSFGGRRFDSCFVAFAFGLGYLIIRPPGPSDSTPRRVLRRTWMATTLVLAVLLAAANTNLTGRHSGPTVRIHGGQPAATILAQQIRAPLGTVTAWLSRAANFPARLVYAWRYHTGLSTYDYVVGVHVLGELYPGLNSFRGKRQQRIALAPSARAIRGLASASARAPTGPPAQPGPAQPKPARPKPAQPKPAQPKAIIADKQVRILFGLNRLGPVQFTVQAAAPGAEPITLTARVNGIEQVRAAVGTEPTTVVVPVPVIQRGTNVLVLAAPSGTRLYALEISSPVDARGR